MRLQIVGVSASLGVRPRIGLLADQLVHILDQILDAGLLLLDLVLAIFAHQQVKHDLHLLDDLLLALDGVAELVVLEQIGQRLELIRDATLLALADGSDQQVGPLGIGLAQVLGELLQRVLEPQVSRADRLLRGRQRRGSLGSRSGSRSGRVLRRDGLSDKREGRDNNQRQEPAETREANRHGTVSERTEWNGGQYILDQGRRRHVVFLTCPLAPVNAATSESGVAKRREQIAVGGSPRKTTNNTTRAARRRQKSVA